MLYRAWTRGRDPCIRSCSNLLVAFTSGLSSAESDKHRDGCFGCCLCVWPRTSHGIPPGSPVPTPRTKSPCPGDVRAVFTQHSGDLGSSSSTNLNSIKLMELDFPALLEGFQINSHASPFPDPRWMEANRAFRLGSVSRAPHSDGPCREAKSKKGKKKGKSVVSTYLSLPPSHPAHSEAECEASTGGQAGWHQTLSKMKGPLEVHNSESKPCVQHVIRTNVRPGG